MLAASSHDLAYGRLANRGGLHHYLLSSCVRLREASRQEYYGVLCFWPVGAVVAGRYLPGRDHVLKRYTKPGGEHCANAGGGRKLAVVGFHVDRRRHGLLLRPAVAPIRGPNRPRIL